MLQTLFLLEANAQPQGGSIIQIVLFWGVAMAFFWFVLIRPQRKRQKEVANMQSSLKVGDPVLTTGGMYGKIVDIVNDNIIIEFGLNKSVRVPIEKAAIAAVREPNLKINQGDSESDSTVRDEKIEAIETDESVDEKQE